MDTKWFLDYKPASSNNLLHSKHKNGLRRGLPKELTYILYIQSTMIGTIEEAKPNQSS